MNSKNTCSMILDLLPLYQEGMVQPETAEAVASHLKSCEACRKAYERMNDKLPLSHPDIANETAKQAAPLRKFRFHFWMNILGLPLWIPLLLVCICVCLSLWVTLFSVVLAIWCIPLATGCVTLASIPALVASCLSGFGGNILFFTGCILAGLGLTVLLGWLCEKLTVQFFRGTAWVCKKTFLRKFYAKKASQSKGNSVK